MCDNSWRMNSIEEEQSLPCVNINIDADVAQVILKMRDSGRLGGEVFCLQAFEEGPYVPECCLGVLSP